MAKRITISVFVSALVIANASGIFAVEQGHQEPAKADASQSSQGSKSERGWGQTVRDTLAHEVDAQEHDSSLWCYRKMKEEKGKEELFKACQAKGTEIDRLIAVNGKMLDEKQRKAEDDRLGHLISNSRLLKKRAQQQNEDAQQARSLLKLIPEALVFQMEGREGDRVKLKFTPNPKFRPATHEAQVFHHMEGTLTLDLTQKRLAEINGRLKSAVKFGGGMLGHLDEGGTFLVKQEEVGRGCWEITTLDVRMNGKALFFKTIGVRQKEVDSEFEAVPQSATIEQAAAMTKENPKIAKQ
jgi:hypothetical protein